MTPATTQQNTTECNTILTPRLLSSTQVQVAAALAQGRSVTAAALQAGVDRCTVYQWLRKEPEFKTAVNSAVREYVATLKDDLRDLSSAALKTLRDLLDNPETPACVRLKTALAVLLRPQFPNQDWNLP